MKYILSIILLGLILGEVLLFLENVKLTDRLRNVRTPATFSTIPVMVFAINITCQLMDGLFSLSLIKVN